MKLLKRLSNGIAKFSETTSSIIIASVAFFLIAQVILRYVFNSGISWVDEYARLATIWGVMLIANALVKDNELISVDFFDVFWGKRFIKWRDTTYQLIFVVILLILIKEGWTQAIESWNVTTATMGIKWFYPYLAIPVGAALILYQYIYKVISFLRRES